MQKLKAKGSQGSWFARIGKEAIPCVWKRRVTVWPRYQDPEASLDQPKWKEYVEAIARTKKVALTDESEDELGKWHRNGYIALYEVKGVSCGQAGLEFEFVKRLADLQ